VIRNKRVFHAVGDALHHMPPAVLRLIAVQRSDSVRVARLTGNQSWTVVPASLSRSWTCEACHLMVVFACTPTSRRLATPHGRAGKRRTLTPVATLQGQWSVSWDWPEDTKGLAYLRYEVTNEETRAGAEVQVTGRKTRDLKKEVYWSGGMTVSGRRRGDKAELVLESAAADDDVRLAVDLDLDAKTRRMWTGSWYCDDGSYGGRIVLRRRAAACAAAPPLDVAMKKERKCHPWMMKKKYPLCNDEENNANPDCVHGL